MQYSLPPNCLFPWIEPKTSIFQKENDNHLATNVSAP